MENYKNVVKTRITLLTIPVLIAVSLGIYSVFFASEATKESYMFGFQCGFSIALGISAIVFIIHQKKILNDEMKLKLQYNKENDERLKAIRAKAGMPLLFITSVGMIVAGVIAGYFSLVIFSALIIAATIQMLIGAIIKLVYTRKL